MKYIATCTRLLFTVRVHLCPFFLWQRLTSATCSSAALSSGPSRSVLDAMYHFQRGFFNARWLIQVMKWSIRRSHCSGQAPCLLMMLKDWAISQTCSFTLLSIGCVVKPPLSCQIPMVSAAHWLTPTPAFLAQTRTCRASIWIVLASVTTDFGNHWALHYILCSHRWSMIEWWTSNALYSKLVLGVLNQSSRVMQCSSRGEEGVSKVLEIASKVGRQGEYIYGLRGFSWSGDIILATIKLGNNFLSIIKVHWFVDWTLRFITKTTKSMLCSQISLMCPCSSSCTPW